MWSHGRWVAIPLLTVWGKGEIERETKIRDNFFDNR